MIIIYTVLIEHRQTSSSDYYVCEKETQVFKNYTVCVLADFYSLVFVIYKTGLLALRQTNVTSLNFANEKKIGEKVLLVSVNK